MTGAAEEEGFAGEAEDGLGEDSLEAAPNAAAWASLAERVRAALPGSDYRQAYYLSLVRQGRAADAQGRASVAAHCRGLAERGADAVLAKTVTSITSSAAPVSVSPLEALKTRWSAAARARAAALLASKGSRLSGAEREAYAAALEAGHALETGQNLRGKLVARLLRAEIYRKRGRRLSGWAATPPPETGPAGPYNDFAALEQTVQRIAALHPEWAAEFMDLYGDMAKIRASYQTLLPTAKKN